MNVILTALILYNSNGMHEGMCIVYHVDLDMKYWQQVGLSYLIDEVWFGLWIAWWIGGDDN